MRPTKAALAVCVALTCAATTRGQEPTIGRTGPTVAWQRVQALQTVAEAPDTDPAAKLDALVAILTQELADPSPDEPLGDFTVWAGPSGFVRSAAVGHLSQSVPAELLLAACLEAEAEDPLLSDHLACAAAEALARAGGDLAARRSMVPRLAEILESHADPLLRERAARALGELRSPREEVSATLMAALDDPEVRELGTPLSGQFYPVRQAAALALRSLGHDVVQSEDDAWVIDPPLILSIDGEALLGSLGLSVQGHTQSAHGLRFATTGPMGPVRVWIAVYPSITAAQEAYSADPLAPSRVEPITDARGRSLARRADAATLLCSNVVCWVEADTVEASLALAGEIADALADSPVAPRGRPVPVPVVTMDSPQEAGPGQSLPIDWRVLEGPPVYWRTPEPVYEGTVYFTAVDMGAAEAVHTYTFVTEGCVLITRTVVVPIVPDP